MGRGEGTTDIWVILNLKITIFQYYKEAHIWRHELILGVNLARYNLQITFNLLVA